MEVAILLMVSGGVIVVVFIIWSNKMEEAKKAYYRSLEKLINNPTNMNIRQEMLYLGRVYLKLTNASVFNEMALMNDFNAATASVVEIKESEEYSNDSIEARLQKLTRLMENGLLTEDEFQSKRKDILDEI